MFIVHAILKRQFSYSPAPKAMKITNDVTEARKT